MHTLRTKNPNPSIHLPNHLSIHPSVHSPSHPFPEPKSLDGLSLPLSHFSITTPSLSRSVSLSLSPICSTSVTLLSCLLPDCTLIWTFWCYHILFLSPCLSLLHSHSALLPPCGSWHHPGMRLYLIRLNYRRSDRLIWPTAIWASAPAITHLSRCQLSRRWWNLMQSSKCTGGVTQEHSHIRISKMHQWRSSLQYRC